MGLRRLAFLCLILAGCGTSPDVRYRSGRLLLKQGKLDQAMLQADAGLNAEHSWRFRILKADILLARSDIAGAKALLSEPGEPMDGESRARRKVDEGWMEHLASHSAQAELLLAQASDIAKPLRMPLLDALIENRMGLVSMRLGRMDFAEQAFRHVIEVTSRQGDPYLQATATGNLGFLFLNDFRLEDAVYWFEKASTLFKQLGNTNSYFITRGNLAATYQRLGDFDRALAGYQ